MNAVSLFIYSFVLLKKTKPDKQPTLKENKAKLSLIHFFTKESQESKESEGANWALSDCILQFHDHERRFSGSASLK